MTLLTYAGSKWGVHVVVRTDETHRTCHLRLHALGTLLAQGEASLDPETHTVVCEAGLHGFLAGRGIRLDRVDVVPHERVDVVARVLAAPCRVVLRPTGSS